MEIEIILYADEYRDKETYQKYNIKPSELEEMRRKMNKSNSAKQKKIEFIELNKLKLDKLNPRIPLSLHDSNEEEIIHWMLEDASIIELMLAIGQNGFFIGEALLVIRETNNYIVIEGNRRLTSLKLLQTPSLATIHTRKIEKVIEETKERPIDIPCIIFDNRDEISQYLGYRHVTGIKVWGMLAKARYLNSLIPTLETQGLYHQSRELAKKIGSRSDCVKRVLVSYKIYEIIKDNNFYKIPQLNETSLHFNYIADSLRHENIKSFINIDLDNNKTLSKINENNLSTLIDWFFRKNEQNRPRVYGHSKDLTSLNSILANKEALEYFKDGNSLEESLKYTIINSDTFHHELKDGLRSLKHAHSFIHQIETHNDNDITTIREIISLCKTMGKTIEEKNIDEWK